MKNKKKMVGWREWVALPSIGIAAIKAKVDTGARTSALHAFKVERFTASDGREWVRFHVHPLQDNTEQVVICEAPLHDQRVVTDSGGHKEMRPVVLTRIRLGDAEFEAELTLTDRESMKFRMLLGRNALIGRYIVDSEMSFCLQVPSLLTTAK